MPRQSAKVEQEILDGKNGQVDVPEGAESVRLEDVLTFLRIYAKADRPQLEDRTNISTLLTDDPDKKGLTTRISQMGRIVKFLYGDDELKRSGLRRLFEKDHIGGLVPSADARELYKHFISLVDVYRDIQSVAEKRRYIPQRLRLGVSHTIGIRLLSSILSDRRRLFPGGIELEVEIADSRDLISRLKARLLDVVIAYGSSNAKTETVDRQTGLAFRSLGYDSRMVLLCSPTDPLWIRGRKKGESLDANAGYWQEKYHGRSRRDPPLYEELHEINLRMIDFKRMRLIVVDSWDQPPGLDTFLKEDPPHQMLRVSRYEQALALVRMGQGVAVATEVFSRRARITAFKLIPKERFVRWIGAYFHPPEDELPAHVRRLVRIVERYIAKCRDDIRRGTPPAYGDERYTTFCDDFLKEPEE